MDQTGRNSVHLPVMVVEVLDFLANVSNGAYLDLTAGLGGHLIALAGVLGSEARLYGVDRDRDAIQIARANLAQISQANEIVHASYVDIADVVDGWPDHEFDGILLDLGLSSLQLDNPSRGFSYNTEGPLDMRFDQKKGLRTAADLVNGLEQSQLVALFRDYGEERRSAQIAAAIVRERQKEMILTTSRLRQIVHSVSLPAHRNKIFSRIFQALRIAVNDELSGLTKTLPLATGLLRKGGRLAVLSYHSLEDRIVKRFFQRQIKGCVCSPDVPVCICGQAPTLKAVTRKALVPSLSEIENNSRARSAKLRVVERI